MGGISGAKEGIEIQQIDIKEEKEMAKLKEKEGDSAVQQIVETIAQMTVLELAELVKALEEKFGVSAAVFAPASIPAQAPITVPKEGGGVTEGAEAEQKTEVSVILVSAGSNKIQTIKVVRAVTGLGLKEAKDLVEGAPKPVKEGIPLEQAKEIQKQLEEVGAKVEIK